MTLLAQFAATGGGVANYIENVFSTYLYTGNGSTQTITNGIDLSTKGGLVWAKSRSNAAYHGLSGPTFLTSYFGGPGGLRSNGTNALGATDFAGVSTTGFNLAYIGGDMNTSGYTYASWTLRKQSKFFDIVTYTGTGVARTVAHNLGSTPGCFIVKRTDTTADWIVYHRSVGATAEMELNTTATPFTSSGYFNNTSPTSTEFTVGTNSAVNASGGTYVAYLFAHDAGGFGLSGSDNVISCGSYTCVAYPGDVTVTLGYEPQWVMVKNATQASNWVVYDNLRGMPGTSAINPVTLCPDTTAAENGTTGSAPGISPTATGFIARAGLTAVSGSAGDKVIYIAIRRGPMKVPTLGTTVYNGITRSGNSTSTTFTGVGFVPDLTSVCARSTNSGFIWQDRLRSATRPLFPAITQLETTYANEVTAINQDGITVGTDTPVNQTGVTYINHFFGRAPSFFDEVCYTGTGSARTVNHNLAAIPELMIFKKRNGASNWSVYSKSLSATDLLYLNYANGVGTDTTVWNSTAPTSSVFSVGTSGAVNTSADTYVAYLFATCAGVSKVGSYTGTGTTQTINCGFTAGSRFVMIKRTDSTGDWYVWDSARGIVPGNDPYLLLNSDAAEVTSTDYVDTANSGFELSSTAPAALNASGGSYIFLAIA